MLSRLFVLIGGLFVLTLLAALVGPYFIDWTSYRSDFEREASAVLGRKVTVEGDASARILPFPSVTFSNVTVGAGSGQPAMTVQTFSMDAELAPMLHGEVLIFDMRLVRPRAVIDVAEDGTVDWAVRPSSPFDPGRIALENLTVTDGEIVLRHHASGREHVVSDIDARLSARSLAGPWRADGTMSFDGRRAAVAASTGKAQAGALRLNLDVTPLEAPLRIALEGDLRLRDGRADYAGNFSISPAAQAKPLRGEAARPAPQSVGYRLSGDFVLNNSQLTVPRFRLETGPRDDPYAAEGLASLDLGAQPRFMVEANGEQVRLDGEEGESGEPGEARGLSLADRISTLEDAVRALPQPGIPGTVKVNLPALVAGDTTMRDLRLAALPQSGGWRIETFAVSLPGRTTLEASGRLDTASDFSFDGSLLLAVAQPSGFASWLGQDVDEAVRRLPAAGFSAKARLSTARQTFEDLELILGEAKLKGSIDSILPPTGSAIRPSLALKLDGGRIDLDRLDVFASLFLSQEGKNRFIGRDVDLDIKAGPVVSGDLAIGRVEATATLSDNTLSLSRLEVADLSGASISATGKLDDLGAAPTGVVKASLRSPDLRPLMATAAAHLPSLPAFAALRDRSADYPNLLSATEMNLDAALGTTDGVTTIDGTVRGRTGGTEISAKLSGGRLDGNMAASSFSFDASLTNADAAPLLGLGGLNAQPLGATGQTTLSLALSGIAAEGLAAKAKIEAPKFSANLDGTVSSGSAGLTAKGVMVLQAEDIEPWMRTLGADLPGFGLGTQADLRGEFDFGDGLLVLSGIEGSIDEGAVAGDLNIATRSGAADITGALSLDVFDVSRAAAVVLGTRAFDLAADGAAVVPFRDHPLPPLSAAVDISAGAVEAGALGTLYDADFNLDIDAERLAISGLTASYHDGAMHGGAELRNSAGTGLLSAQFDLENATLAEPFDGGGIQGLGDFSGTLSAAGKSVDGMLAALAGSGTARLTDLHIAGMNQKALPALLAKGDGEGRQISNAQVAGFAPSIASDGSFVVPRADIAFTIAGGVLRAPPIALANKDARLDADLRADLASGSVSAHGTITYSAGTEALVGSEPALNVSFEGPFASSRLVFDGAPLAQFLSQRSLEKEQRRVEALQDALLEKQRLRRETRYYEGLTLLRSQQAAERLRLEEAVRLRAEDRAALEADERERAAAGAEEQRKAEEAIRLAESERRAREQRRRAVDIPTILSPRSDAGRLGDLNFDSLPAPENRAPGL